MAKVHFILNNEEVEAEAGSTILQAAEQNGIPIPTLCHDPRLKPTAACRLCLVEVEGARGPVPACATTLTENMVVKTVSDDLLATRRTALELMLSDHYGDCIAPCSRACPAGIDIQGYIAHIANGQYREAIKLIKQSNPLPLICGRVCPRFCEMKCRRNLIEGPVSINALKRFVADYDLDGKDRYLPDLKPASRYRVAIVGGGPAGLSAAYYLALEGHRVTIFDSSPKLGGMLRYGIPEYRLPKAILDREIAFIIGLCRNVRLGARFGKDFTIDSLKHDGYDAIFIALGAQVSQDMGVEGEHGPHVISGIGFLRDVALNKKLNIGKKVVVVGGGNTAMDAARTALRTGAQEVTVVYRRSRAEMPANDEEIEQAEEEGISFRFLAVPLKISAAGNKGAKVKCIRMELGEPDSSGRRSPVPVKGSEFIIEADTVIAAVGQTIDPSGLDRNKSIELGRKNYINVNGETMETSLPGVFAGGDCVSGPATAVEAIAAGKRAAYSIDLYLNGMPVEPATKHYNCSKGELNTIDVRDYDKVERIPRVKMAALAPQERKSNFKEIEAGLTAEMAEEEARRCLACGCQDVFECKLRQLATEYRVDDKHYSGRKRHISIPENDHPNILREPDKCILCGRCVRICSELQGVGVLGFIHRGFDTVVGPAIGMTLQQTSCTSCGQCVSTCPTGAMTQKPVLDGKGPWETDTVQSVCPSCGTGCNLQLNVAGDILVNVTSSGNSVVNSGNLCRKGMFDYSAVQDSERLSVPMVRKDGGLIEVSWDEAICLAGEHLRSMSNRSGGNKLAVLSSGRSTNEESFLLQKFARAALNTNNIGCVDPSVMNDGLMKSIGRNASTCSYNDIFSSDLIMTIGEDIQRDYPVIASKIRKAVEGGSSLVTVSPNTTVIDSLARIDLRVNQRLMLALLRAMLNYIIEYELVDRDFLRKQTEGFDDYAGIMKKYPFEQIVGLLWVKPARIIEMVHLYSRAKKPVFIVDAGAVSASEMKLIGDIAMVTGNILKTGSGIIVLRTPGNAQGLIDMGVSPDFLPGHRPLNNDAARQQFETLWNTTIPQEKGLNAYDIIERVRSGNIDGVVAFGDGAFGKQSLLEEAAFSVLVSSTIPEGPVYPDVLLPLAQFYESEGTFTNCERRVQQLRRALAPLSGKENWQIITSLSKAAGYVMKYNGVSDIAAEIAQCAPMYMNCTVGTQWPLRIPRVTFSAANGSMSYAYEKPAQNIRTPEITESSL